MMLFAIEEDLPHEGPMIWSASMEINEPSAEQRQMEVITEAYAQKWISMQLHDDDDELLHNILDLIIFDQCCEYFQLCSDYISERGAYQPQSEQKNKI